MSEWHKTLLGKIVEITNGYAFKSINFSNVFSEGSLPVVKIRNVANGDVNLDNVQYHKTDKKLSKYISVKGDILIAMTGNHPQALTQVVGAVSKQKINQQLYINQRVAKISSLPTLSIDDFIYYYLKDESVHEYLANQSSGSANQANISKSDIENLELFIPCVQEQKAITSVLSSLDDKIDLLHRQNKTLESMAETLFRQWFVEEAQDDWKEVNVLDIFSLVGGGTPKTSIDEYWNGNIPWISGGDISQSHKGFISKTEKSITELGLKNSSTKLLPKLSTIISARGTVGKYALLEQEMCFSQSNYGIIPKGHNCYYFVYLLIGFIVDELLAAAYGSVFDTITTRTFESIDLKLPEMSEIINFEATVIEHFKKKELNSRQIQTLENLRDTLLPKLMSGEVRVNYTPEEIKQ